jgi:type IV secretion system protein VirD4
MIERATFDLVRAALRLGLKLWPLWLLWLVWTRFDDWWISYLSAFPDHSTTTYTLAYRAWPSVALLGPVLLMLAAVLAYRLHFASRILPFAGIAGVLGTSILTGWPEYQRLAPYVGSVPVWEILRALNLNIVQAVAFGSAAALIGVRLMSHRALNLGVGPPLLRGLSDNFGHADWLSIRDAHRLFPGPDKAYGGIVVGEAYRVDHDRVARRAFDANDRRTWGLGGGAPLLVDPCHTGSTHALVFSGPGGFKTTSVGIPTMLTWRGAAVVLDPSREIGPMVQAFRQSLGHRVVSLDPGEPAAGAFNVLDWIDVTSPEAETNVEAAVNWICGEPRGAITAGAEFFREGGKGLIACLLADLLWDRELAPEGRRSNSCAGCSSPPKAKCVRSSNASTSPPKAHSPVTLQARSRGWCRKPFPGSMATPTRTPAGYPSQPMPISSPAAAFTRAI